MYTVKPILENVVLNEIYSATLYKCQNYFEGMDAIFGGNSSTGASLTPEQLEDLAKQQQKQLRRLNRLTGKTNELCDDISLEHLIIQTKKPQANANLTLEQVNKRQQEQSERLSKINQRLNQICDGLGLVNLKTESNTDDSTVKQVKIELINVDLNDFKDVKRVPTKVNKDKTTVDDFVINIDGNSNLPYKLFYFLDQLTLKQKSYVKYHLHHASKKDDSNQTDQYRLENVQHLFSQLKLDVYEPRSNYDSGLTFISKKSGTSDQLPVLVISEKNKIVGEDNIIEYLNYQLFGLDKSKRVDVSQFNKAVNSNVLLKYLKKIFQ